MSDMNPVTESPIFAHSDDGLPPTDPQDGQAKSHRRMIIIAIVITGLLLALLAGAFTWYLTTKKPLTQLPILSQTIPPHYSATLYDVAKPVGVAVDEVNDRVYVTQSDGPRDVAVFDSAGARIGALKPPAATPGVHTPVYVAVDPTTSNVYVSDRAVGAVYVYDPTGTFLREFKPKGVKTWQPLGLAFDSEGNLYATDVTDNAQRVLKVAPDQKVVQSYGDKDGLSFPNGVALTADGALVVADSNNSRALLYAKDGTLIGALPRGAAETPLGLPRGVAVDDRGRIYVVDTTNQNFQVFTPASDPGSIPEYAFTSGDEGTAEGTFSFPNGIATDTHGRVYIADRENNRVQVWSY
jgi:DNA-binding beta-propeller fold protein YncE